MYCQLQLQTKTISSLLIALYGFQLLICATSLELERNCAIKLKKVILEVLSGGGICDVVEIKVCFVGNIILVERLKRQRAQQESDSLMYIGGTRTT